MKPTVDEMIARLPADQQTAVLAKAEEITQARTAARGEISIDELMSNVLTPAEQETVRARAKQINIERDAVATTRKAIAELEAGKGQRFTSVVDLMADLKCDPNAPLPRADGWDEMAPVGKEILD